MCAWTHAGAQPESPHVCSAGSTEFPSGVERGYGGMLISLSSFPAFLPVNAGKNTCSKIVDFPLAIVLLADLKSAK